MRLCLKTWKMSVVCDEITSLQSDEKAPKSTMMPVFDFAHHVQSPFELLSQFAMLIVKVSSNVLAHNFSTTFIPIYLTQIKWQFAICNVNSPSQFKCTCKKFVNYDHYTS